ncbi:cytochrome P450 [Trametes punicea]|nr:cytochrome P450 [Trametes punicea]
MGLSLPFIAGLSALFFVLWHVLREYFVKSPVDNLQGPPSPSLLQGHISSLFEAQGWKFVKDVADKYGSVVKLRGILGARMLLVHDPKALHSVLIKDAEAYPKCAAPFDDFIILLGPSLLAIEGAQHRRQRKQLTPVFSPAHLRNMTDIFYDVARRTCRAIEDRVGSSPSGGEVDVHSWMGRTTLEILGQAALGYSFDNFVDDSADAFGELLKEFFPMYSRVALMGFVVPIMSYVMPPWLVTAVLRSIPHRGLQEMMQTTSKMAQRSQEIVNEKKMRLMKGDDQLKREVEEGKDLMSILLKANMVAAKADWLTDQELIAQVSTFILAGMDTTANALTRALHILAEHPAEQEKLRAEVIEARNGNDLSYDALDKLEYLDAVCRETLRLWAPVNVISRDAAKDMRLPLHTPVVGQDGTVMNEIPVPAGTSVLVNLQGLNCNRSLWGEDAYEWKPERWLKPLPSALEDARVPGVYSNLMTFSGGARSCIGFKFSQLTMKVVLSLLVSSFKLEMGDKPVVWKTSSVTYPTVGEESTRPELFLKVIKVAT